MISLRKHMDEFTTPSEPTPVVASEPVPAPRTEIERRSYRPSKGTLPKPPLDPAVSAFCNVLTAVGESGQRAVPGLGDELIRNFAQIQEALARMPNRENVTVSSQRARAELTRWADRAWQYHADKGREIKEIINVVARASENVSERDKKYADQLGDVGGRLGAIVELDDLRLIRRAILDSTRTLKACVAKMTEESRQTVARLGQEVAEYRTRLAEAERVSCTDDLTQVGNRRAFETELEHRITSRHEFSLIMVDLNDFKSVNDTLGHVAGDDLLRQFAGELRLQFRTVDLVARWGGDEFAAIIAGPPTEAEARVGRIRRWVLGDYKISVGNEIAKVDVKAALGFAAWNGNESGAELLARADQSLYADKATIRTT
jgi:diguanylate cyclase